MDVSGNVLDGVLVVFGIITALYVAETLRDSLLQFFALVFVLTEEPLHCFPHQPLRTRIVSTSDPRSDQFLKFPWQLDCHQMDPC